MSHSLPTASFFQPSIKLCIAAAGTGIALERLVQLIVRPDFTQAFPGVRICAFTHVDGQVLPQELHHIPRYQDIATALEKHPEITVFADMTDSGQHIEQLRQELPLYLPVINATTVMAFFHIITSEQLCQTCNIHLAHARTLFETLINYFDEDILLLDTKGQIVDVNQTVLDRRGGTKSYWQGHSCCDLEGQEFCATCQGACPFQETIRTGTKSEQVHTRMNPDGKVSYHRVYTYPVHNNQGVLTNVIELRRDITARTIMERKLQQAEKMAAIGELATYIAHEIRNPLFAIGGFANSLLRSSSLDESAREKVRIILDESKRLDGILRSTMNFAKPSDPKRANFDLNNLTNETIALMRMNDEKLNITITLELAENLPMAIGDVDMTKQCLINLVKNAQEAMPKGGDLTIRTGMTQTEVFIQVKDTGTGIPVDLRESIFSPFFSTKDKGAGLGLAMTKKLIEEMGGTVALETEEGKGTCITVSLQPLLTADTSAKTDTDKP